MRKLLALVVLGGALLLGGSAAFADDAPNAGQLIVGQTVYQTVYQTVPYTVDERTTPSVAITQAQ